MLSNILVTLVIAHISVGLTLSSICNTLTDIKPVLIYTYRLTTTRSANTRTQAQKLHLLKLTTVSIMPVHIVYQ